MSARANKIQRPNNIKVFTHLKDPQLYANQTFQTHIKTSNGLNIQYTWANTNVSRRNNGFVSGYPRPSINGIYNSGQRTAMRLTYNFIGLYTADTNKIFSSAELYVPTNQELPIEIYSVYTDPTYRGKKYATLVLNLIKSLYPDRDLWLGVRREDNTNAYFKSRVKMYAESGFTSGVKISKTTPRGKNLLSNFIEMTYKAGKTQTSVNAVNKTIAKASMLMNTQRYPRRLYKARFHISADYVNEVRHVVLLNRYNTTRNEKEYGGAIQFTYSGFKKNGAVYTFESENQVSRHKTGTGGSSKYNYTVDVPPTNIPNNYLVRWHTHPEKCYRQFGLCVALPSAEDLRVFLIRYMNRNDTTGINLIFTLEGVYVIRLTSKFMTAVERLRPWGSSLAIIRLNEINDILIPQLTQMALPQWRANPLGNRRALIRDYFNALQAIKTPRRNIQIFKIELKEYTNNRSGISFDATLYSQSVINVKEKSKSITPAAPSNFPRRSAAAVERNAAEARAVAQRAAWNADPISAPARTRRVARTVARNAARTVGRSADRSAVAQRAAAKRRAAQYEAELKAARTLIEAQQADLRAAARTLAARNATRAQKKVALSMLTDTARARVP